MHQHKVKQGIFAQSFSPIFSNTIQFMLVVLILWPGIDRRMKTVSRSPLNEALKGTICH
jgi:hypothetical protein